MGTTVVMLLAACVGLAGLGYYLGYARPTRVLAWLGQASFIFLTFFMAPLLAVVLWLQFGAKDRLSKAGIVPHPAIEETVGVAMGLGDNPTWVFALDASADPIIDFYHVEGNRPGWELVSKGHELLVLRRDRKKMIIGTYKGWRSHTITYQLTEKADSS